MAGNAQLPGETRPSRSPFLKSVISVSNHKDTKAPRKGRFLGAFVSLWLLTLVTIAFSFSWQETSRRPSGVLTGRIVDDEGRPMRGVQVQALALGYPNGRRQM